MSKLWWLWLVCLLAACDEGAAPGGAGGGDAGPSGGSSADQDAGDAAEGERIGDAADLDAGRGYDATWDGAPRPDVGSADAAPMDAGSPTDARVPMRPDELPGDPVALPGAADLTARVEPGRARAGRVDTPEEALTGPNARCRVGCFRLDNAHLSVCVEGPQTFSQFTFTGGKIIDLHPADEPGSDLFEELVVAPAVGEVRVDRVEIVADGADGGGAAVRAWGRASGGRLLQSYVTGAFVPPDIEVITEYRLAPDAHAVDVLTWLHDDTDRGVSFLMADMVFFGDGTRGFVPGGPVEGSSLGEADFAAGSRAGFAVALSSLRGPVQLLDIGVQGFRASPILYGQVFLRPDDMVLVRRRLLTGRDMEAVRPAPEGHAVTLRGPPGAWVEVDRAGRRVTRALLDAAGERVVRLAEGRYRVRSLDWPGGDPAPVVLQVPTATELRLRLPEPARLDLQVRDGEGRPIPARVALTGPTRLLRFVVGDETVTVPPGTYRAVTTRGWHYEVDDRQITLEPGAELSMQVTLVESIPLGTMTSGDFHQHASPSSDSSTPAEILVLMNMAAGVGFMVPSDHEVQYDWRRLIARMGVGDWIGSPISGLEISPLRAHLGAYGIPFDANAGAGNAPPLVEQREGVWRLRSMAELVADARARGARTIQINHPRATQGYFDLVELDPTTPLAALEGDPEWTRDVDAVEVYNSPGDFCRVLADWMALQNQGMRLTAVGNSDTHVANSPAGSPRNYLRTAAAAPHLVSADEIVTALREGRMTLGSGAMMDFPGAVGPGDTLAAVGGRAGARVRVRTPGWTRVDRLLVFYNGAQVLDRPLEGSTEAIVDLDERIEVDAAVDGALVFLALGSERMTYVDQSPVLALANPIFVDADGDGVYSPPGIGPVTRLELDYCR